ncbi:MAG: MBL fold metallo-hydrolase [Gemmiger sp.]
MELLHITGPAPLWTNTFLIFTQAGHAVAIDPAASSARYLDALAERGATLTHILLTHGHYDHVDAVQALKQKTGARVWMDPADAQGTSMFPLREVDAGYPVEGTFTIDELTFRCWHTPGHTRGSWCLWCDGRLFSGDTLFAGSCGRVDLPGGSAREMQQSLALLAGLTLPDETRVYPGHDSFTTLGQERCGNPYMLGQWY